MNKPHVQTLLVYRNYLLRLAEMPLFVYKKIKVKCRSRNYMLLMVFCLSDVSINSPLVLLASNCLHMI